MSSHEYHPPIREAGPADGCPRCVQIAADPLANLDADTFRACFRRAVAIEQDAPGAGRYNGEADARMGALLWRFHLFASQYPDLV